MAPLPPDSHHPKARDPWSHPAPKLPLPPGRRLQRNGLFSWLRSHFRTPTPVAPPETAATPNPAGAPPPESKPSRSPLPSAAPATAPSRLSKSEPSSPSNAPHLPISRESDKPSEFPPEVVPLTLHAPRDRMTPRGKRWELPKGRRLQKFSFRSRPVPPAPSPAPEAPDLTDHFEGPPPGMPGDPDSKSLSSNEKRSTPLRPTAPKAGAFRNADQAKKPARRGLWKRIRTAGGEFFLVSVIVHAVLLLLAAFWVVQTVQAKRRLNFTSAPPSGAGRGSQIEHRVQTALRSQNMSAPPASNRITSTSSNAKVSLPDVPSFNATSSALPNQIAGIAGTSVSFSSMAGKAAMIPPSIGMGITAFGFRGAMDIGLQGTLYDLKQSASKEPLSNPSQAVDDLKTFAKNWDPAILGKYYRAKNTLSAQRIYFPELSAVEAPRAFGVESEVKPSLWIVHYRGKVTPPRNGTFRFRGFADDWLTVRFDGKTVFDGGLFVLDPDTHETKSTWIPMQAGKTYEIEILIGTYPGSMVYANLFVEEKNRVYEKDESGEPIWQLFQIGKTEPPKFPPESRRLPKYSKEELVFRLAR
ncbi:MAG: hypothetical protein RLZZ244_74 [Verrucomicrobiota bacterium]